MTRPLPWKHRINVADIFHDDNLTITEKRTKIVARLRKSAWLLSGDEDLAAAINSLARVRTVEGFDRAWSDIYDLADADRVWITTR